MPAGPVSVPDCALIQRSLASALASTAVSAAASASFFADASSVPNSAPKPSLYDGSGAPLIRDAAASASSFADASPVPTPSLHDGCDDSSGMPLTSGARTSSRKRRKAAVARPQVSQLQVGALVSQLWINDDGVTTWCTAYIRIIARKWIGLRFYDDASGDCTLLTHTDVEKDVEANEFRFDGWIEGNLTL